MERTGQPMYKETPIEREGGEERGEGTVPFIKKTIREGPPMGFQWAVNGLESRRNRDDVSFTIKSDLWVRTETHTKNSLVGKNYKGKGEKSWFRGEMRANRITDIGHIKEPVGQRVFKNGKGVHEDLRAGPDRTADASCNQSSWGKYK